jgi:hypothetical protein
MTWARLAAAHAATDQAIGVGRRTYGPQWGMARRNHLKRAGARHQHDDRPLSLGMHWRSDGAPKTAYRSQQEAWSMADERRGDTGVDLNVYRCDVCSGWHLGRSSERDR